MNKVYPLFKVHTDKKLSIKNIETVLDSGFINEGEQVKQLTNQLVPILGSKKLVLTNSGTSALTLAYKLSGLKPGKNIVSTPMTCIASNTPIINLGGQIRWADVDPETGMITKRTIEAAVDKNTVAVSFVDWAGVTPNLNEIFDFCKDRKIKLVQDAAHAFMAEYNGQPICNFSDFTCFSFQAIKHFTCGDGGALVVSNDEYYAKAKKLKWFGYDRESSKDELGNWKAQQAEADIERGEVGYKFNMNNISAAIGISNIPHISNLISKHRQNAETYLRIFEPSKFITPIKVQKNSKPVYWVFTIMLPNCDVRDRLIEKLKEFGIHSGQVHIPNDGYACFKDFATELPGVREFANRQLSLPCGWWLEKEDIDFISGKVLESLNDIKF